MTPAQVLRWALRLALPAPADWLADLVAGLVEDVPQVVRASRGGWTVALEAELRDMVADALDELPGVTDEEADQLAEAVVIIVRRIHEDCADIAERRRARKGRRHAAR
jgi:hypothetical protein